MTHWIDASGSVLTLTDLGRTHSGNYTCTADNGVGPPVSRVTSVDILCKYIFNYISRGSTLVVFVVVEVIGLNLVPTLNHK